MPKNLTLILGDQLFQNHPAFTLETDYVMLESKDFNTEHKYHKTRLNHCFMAMREYADYLSSQNKKVIYWGIEKQKTLSDMFDFLVGCNYTDLYIADIDDKALRSIISQLCEFKSLVLHILPSPKFLTSKEDWQDYRTKHSKRLNMNDFYIMQRRRLGLFLDDKGNSSFGKWSLDEDNRKKLPKTEQVDNRLKVYNSKHEKEVTELIQKYFPDNPCEITPLYFPVNHVQAQELLQEFGTKYFSKFGDYEDAMSARDPFLFHSTISPLLNNGLLTPREVIDWVLTFREQSSKVKPLSGVRPTEAGYNIPNNSIEGFIRQVIGWREWVNCLFWNVYDEDIIKYNFFNNTAKLPGYFWDRDELEKIKFNIPLYNALNNVFDYGYCHHIERLMVIANWMTLNEYDPMECYNWFMAMFIDSYDWVMVANVMGMGLYADGGIFATKPYVAGGNYLKKMSDYQSGKGEAEWEKLWTDKFWYFVLKHEKVFLSNPRMNMLIQAKKNKMKD
jgi:deoxyribodipyrimidine photolyase-related protein